MRTSPTSRWRSRQFNFLHGSKVTGYDNNADVNGYPDLALDRRGELTADSHVTSQRLSRRLGVGRQAPPHRRSPRCGTDARASTGGGPAVIAYIIRRLVAGVVLIVVMSLVTFVLFFASPIDPARFACGKNCSPAQQEQTAARRWATTTAVFEQWGEFLKGVVVGRDYPDDPALQKTAPEMVDALRRAVPGLLRGQRTRRSTT